MFRQLFTSRKGMGENGNSKCYSRTAHRSTVTTVSRNSKRSPIKGYFISVFVSFSKVRKLFRIYLRI